MHKVVRSVAFWVVLALVVVVGAAQVLTGGGDERQELRYDEFRDRVVAGEVADAAVDIGDRTSTITGELVNGTTYETTFATESSDRVTSLLDEADLPYTVDTEEGSFLVSMLISLLPFVLILGIFLFFINSMQGGGNKVMQFGKSKAKPVAKDQPKVTFADVAGSDEAVEELQEIKEFLESPAKFQAIGAKIPKGVLLFGPPGTGKTLLARAVAGEAGVPFFSISGSDFVEMFVGVGASRVRDLFEQAKAASPAIIFVDEIDAVGRHRGAGMGGGHDEREQTLNQLLVEMDGFDVKSGVILIAATNRPDILDPALLRPGRFDRQIVVDRPDMEGRRAILNVHGKGKPLGSDIDIKVLARRTPGFTGADLANLMNEAALLTARRGDRSIDMSAMEEAIDRVMAGPERKSRVMSDKEKRVIAYHEGGHALVGHVLPGTDPIHKVSIVARGRALGWTLALPTEDKHMQTRSELRDELAMLLGGRTAEELVFGDPTTGAQNDIERATQIARSMVTEFGMADDLGPQQLGQKAGEPFLGRDMGHERNYSDEVAAKVDSEVRRLIDNAHTEAEEILCQHRATLDRLADALIEHETLDTAELMEIFGELPEWSGVDAAPAKRRAPARPRAAKGAVAAAATAADDAPAPKGRPKAPARRRRPSAGPAPA
ncbi:MAG TPA: ATP-dependent zinc metalloprotease FtsH [Acidimicrobiales bacterium]|nr:ATP-dependent zinc metalloprotease FtsH [Acidimicrobiales bacterium]